VTPPRRLHLEAFALLLIASVFAVGCDAHIRAWGHVATPANEPLANATIRVFGRSERVKTVTANGEFDVSLVHGGKTNWVFEAPGYQAAEKTLRGTGRYRCAAILVPLDAPKKAESYVACERQ